MKVLLTSSTRISRPWYSSVTPLALYSFAYEMIEHFSTKQKGILEHTEVWLTVTSIKSSSWHGSDPYGMDMRS